LTAKESCSNHAHLFRDVLLVRTATASYNARLYGRGLSKIAHRQGDGRKILKPPNPERGGASTFAKLSIALGVKFSRDKNIGACPRANYR
jgi:hypothetical protein